MNIKEEIVGLCRTKLLASISTLQAAMHELQEQANDYGQPKDRYDSFKTQLLRRKDMLAQQLAKELNELKLLEKINIGAKSEKIGFGSVIFTDDLNYFTGIGLGKIDTSAGTFYTISMLVPLATVLLNKKPGDSIIFRDKKILIKNVQ